MQISYSLPEAVSIFNYRPAELWSKIVMDSNNFLYVILSGKDHEQIKKPCVYRLTKNILVDLMHLSGNLDDYELEIEVFPMIRQNHGIFYLMSTQDIVNRISSKPSKKIQGPMVVEHIAGIENKIALQRCVDENYDECRLVKKHQPMIKRCTSNIILRVKIDLNSIFITSDSHAICNRLLDDDIPWEYNPRNPSCAPRAKHLYKAMNLAVDVYKKTGKLKAEAIAKESLNSVGLDPNNSICKKYSFLLSMDGPVDGPTVNNKNISIE